MSLAVPLQNSGAEFTTLFQALNLSRLENRAEAKHLSDILENKAKTANWMSTLCTKLSFLKKENMSADKHTNDFLLTPSY